jgi:hypothetical protein
MRVILYSARVLNKYPVPEPIHRQHTIQPRWFISGPHPPIRWRQFPASGDSELAPPGPQSVPPYHRHSPRPPVCFLATASAAAALHAPSCCRRRLRATPASSSAISGWGNECAAAPIGIRLLQLYSIGPRSTASSPSPPAPTDRLHRPPAQAVRRPRSLAPPCSNLGMNAASRHRPPPPALVFEQLLPVSHCIQVRCRRPPTPPSALQRQPLIN